MAREWHQLAELVQGMGNAFSQTQLELKERRAEPGNLWRYRSGAAKVPDAYTATLLRNGHEYTGGPVPEW